MTHTPRKVGDGDDMPKSSTLQVKISFSELVLLKVVSISNISTILEILDLFPDIAHYNALNLNLDELRKFANVCIHEEFKKRSRSEIRLLNKKINKMLKMHRGENNASKFSKKEN